MSDQSAEGLDPEADGESGSPAANEDKSKSRWVPYDRFAKVVAKLSDATDKLNQTLAAQGTKQVETPVEKALSPAELRAKVDSGELSPDDAERIREAQLTKRVVKEVVGATQQHSRELVWAAELQEYETAVPALKDQASEEFARVKEEYEYMLSSLGHPPGLNTMLAATRAVYGSVKALKAPAGSKPKVEAHEDVGGGDAPPPDGDKAVPKLTAKQKDHYRRAIDRGAYANWSEVYAEVRFSEKRRRA